MAGQEGGESQNPEGGKSAAGSEPQQQQPVDGGWISTLDPELQKSPALKKFKGKDWNEVGPQAVKSYINLEKWQIPGDDATPEARSAFHRRMGVPEKIEDYKIAPTIPDGVPWNDGVQGEFVKFVHAEGVPPGLATKMVNWWAEQASKGVDFQTTQTADEVKKTHGELQSKWGANWKRNTGLVNRAVEEYGSESFNALLDTQVVDGMKLGNHPVMLEFLKNYGESRLEAGFISGDTLMTTSNDALAEVNKILDDKSHPYWQGDKAALKKVSDLMALAYPNRNRE